MTTETQSQPPEFRFQREKAWIAVLLAWVAGFADGIGYITLIHIFTSHVSGNTVTMGIYLSRGQLSAALRSAFPIWLFLLGVFLGALLGMATNRKGIKRRLSIGLLLETALLLVFMLYGCYSSAAGNLRANQVWNFHVLTSLLAIALGIQSSTLRRVRGQSVHTTYITGMLTQVPENLAAWLFNQYDRLRGLISNEPDSKNKDLISQTLLHGGIWLAFALGAFCGGFGEQQWGLAAMLAPICVLAFVILCDLIRPVHG